MSEARQARRDGRGEQMYFAGDTVFFNSQMWIVKDSQLSFTSWKYRLMNADGRELRLADQKDIQRLAGRSRTRPAQNAYSHEQDDNNSLEQNTNKMWAFLYRGRSMGLPVVVEKESQLLLPDTGAARNVISLGQLQRYPQVTVIEEEEGSKKLDFAPVSLSGSVLRFKGYVMLGCSFGDNVQSSVRFEVIDSVRDMFLLGRDFVQQYNLFTSNWSWLQPLKGHNGIRQINSLGSAASLLEIKLNSLPVKAYADSGCEVDLLSERFVTENQSLFRMLSMKSSEYVTIEFPMNGPKRDLERLTRKVAVSVSIARDRYIASEGLTHENATGDSAKSGEHQKTDPGPFELSNSRTFYVSQKSQRDVVLSQAFLHSMDAYRRFPNSFSEIHEVVCSLQPVYRDEKNVPLLSATPTTKKAAAKQIQDKKLEWRQLKKSMDEKIDELRQQRAEAPTPQLDADIARKEQKRADTEKKFKDQLKTLAEIIKTFK